MYYILAYLLGAATMAAALVQIDKKHMQRDHDAYVRAWQQAQRDWGIIRTRHERKYRSGRHREMPLDRMQEQLAQTGKARCVRMGVWR